MKMCKKCGVRPRPEGRSYRYCVECRGEGRYFPSQIGVSAQARKFGITVEQIEAMEREQGGRCAICGQVEPEGKRLAVDHDHSCCPGQSSCGKCVRGLLCGPCNKGIGHLRDDPKLLQSAAQYLLDFRTS